MNISEHIREQYHEMSPGKRTIADYIYANQSTVAYCSAGELARRTGVSNALIAKFVKSIGFVSYREMQRALQESAGMQHAMSDSLLRFSQDRDKNPVAMMLRIARQDQENLQKTLTRLAPEQLEQAAAAIVQANRVAFVGTRGAAGCNVIPSLYMREMRDNVWNLTPDVDNGFDVIKWWDRGDLVIGLNTFRYGGAFVSDMMDLAHERGCKTIYFTDMETFHQTQVKPYDFLFQYAAENATISYTSMIMLFNMLNYLVSQQLGQQALDGIRRSEQLLRCEDARGGRTAFVEGGAE